jgi:hypothetical protein
MKSGDKSKKHCDKACGAFVFLAIVLLAVSQLLGETEKFGDMGKCENKGWGPGPSIIDMCTITGGPEEGGFPVCTSDGGQCRNRTCPNFPSGEEGECLCCQQ